MKTSGITPRFNAVDFHLASELAAHALVYPDTNFADWPLTYDELEPFYTEAERLTGVQGLSGSAPLPIRWVLVRCPAETFRPHAFFCTDQEATPLAV